MTSAFLKITSTPPGEAPAWVRDQWVGLSLPLDQSCAQLQVLPTFGVLSQPKTWIGQLVAVLLGRAARESGHVVECVTAVDILERASPEAAAWWREHTPAMMQPGKYFLFHEGVGHVQNAP